MADIYIDVIMGSPTIVGGGQTERRVGVVMELDEAIVPLREKWMITKASGGNISKLEIKPNDSGNTNWREVPLNKNIQMDISDCAEFDARIRVTRTTIDNTSTVYLFTKVIE